MVINSIDQIVKNVSRIKLRGGIVGKISCVLIFVSISIALVACSVKIFLVSVLALFMIFILAIVIIWRLINFSYANPYAALMEGAELLIHEQMMIASKNNPEKIVNPSDLSENKPLILSTEEKSTLNKPDTSKGPDVGGKTKEVEKNG